MSEQQRLFVPTESINAPIEEDKQLKKRDSGSCDYRFDTQNEILAITWHDNNCVKLLSNHDVL